MEAKVASLGAPQKISGFIKFMRYTMLVSGIYYGFAKHNYYKRMQTSFRQKHGPIYFKEMERKKAEQEMKSKEEILNIEKSFREVIFGEMP